MFKKVQLAVIAAALGSAFIAVGAAQASVTVGQPAPNFTLTDLTGKKVSLADLKGKTVVMEWHNPKCPFVVKHYDSNNMQGLQTKYNADTVWVTVNSTNPTHGDFMDNAKLAAYVKDQKAAMDHYATDADGTVGKLFGAKTTPHMYIIDKDGKVAYAGGIDDKRSAKKEDVAGAKNFVSSALDEIKAGKAVSVNSSQPYGCSVKYK